MRFMTLNSKFVIFTILMVGSTKAFYNPFQRYKPFEGQVDKWGLGAKRLDPKELGKLIMSGMQYGVISQQDGKQLAVELLSGKSNKKIELSPDQMDVYRYIYKEIAYLKE